MKRYDRRGRDSIGLFMILSRPNKTKWCKAQYGGKGKWHSQAAIITEEHFYTTYHPTLSLALFFQMIYYSNSFLLPLYWTAIDVFHRWRVGHDEVRWNRKPANPDPQDVTGRRFLSPALCKVLFLPLQVRYPAIKIAVFSLSCVY